MSTAKANTPRAHLDTATRDSSPSPPAERGERVGERGIDGFADLGGSGFPTGRPPLPNPLLQRRRGRSGRGLVAVSRCAPLWFRLRRPGDSAPYLPPWLGGALRIPLGARRPTRDYGPVVNNHQQENLGAG